MPIRKERTATQNKINPIARWSSLEIFIAAGNQISLEEQNSSLHIYHGIPSEVEAGMQARNPSGRPGFQSQGTGLNFFYGMSRLRSTDVEQHHVTPWQMRTEFVDPK